MRKLPLLLWSILAAGLLVGCLKEFPAPPTGGQPTLDLGTTSIDYGPRTDERDRGVDELEAQVIDPLPDAGASPEMQCNALDDDGDGRVDEGFALGVDCVIGVGRCAASGRTICGSDGDVACDGVPLGPTNERCNGEDDDCDGRVDEELGLGERCTAGRGVCAREGVFVCREVEPICDASPGAPERPRCDGEDDDCDGLIDESFGLGEGCTVGVGLCAASGRVECNEDGTAMCRGTVGQPVPERCNVEDDDCDGVVDEGYAVGRDCAVGVGACRRSGITICGGDEGAETSCSVVPGTPEMELCNGQDDDCDGDFDEEYEIGEPCEQGIGECTQTGLLVCADDGVSNECQVGEDPIEPAPEVCDGLDQDCDGSIDEGAVCADYAAENCRVWLGFTSQSNARDYESRPDWGDCPAEPSDTDGRYRCESTRGEARFRVVEPNGEVGDGDYLAVAFTCDSDDYPDVGRWIQSHCAVYFGHADNHFDDELEGAAEWGPCPQSSGIDAQEQNLRCIHSEFDGLFHAIPLVGRVDDNDGFSVAFRCRDETQPARASGLASSVEVFLGWAEARWRLSGNDQEWGNCPAEARDNDGFVRCVASQGTQRFHRIDIPQVVANGDIFSVMFRARPMAP